MSCESMPPFHVCLTRTGGCPEPTQVSKHPGGQSLCSSFSEPQLIRSTLGLQNESCMHNSVFWLNIYITFIYRVWVSEKYWSHEVVLRGKIFRLGGTWRRDWLQTIRCWKSGEFFCVCTRNTCANGINLCEHCFFHEYKMRNISVCIEKYICGENHLYINP